MYYFHPGRFGFIQSTKGHSVLKKWAYGQRAGGVDYDDSYVERYVPTFIPRHYDTGREEREIHRGVDREIIFSDHMMDECYDTARKSHNKDAALLREATAAVVNSETYSDPRAVVASRRAARGVSYYREPPRYLPPPPPQQPHQQPPRTNYPSRRLEKEVVVLFNPYRLRPRPASSYYARVLAKVAMAGRVSLADYHPSPVTRTDLDREMAKRTELVHTIGRPWFYRRPYYSWYPYYSMYRYYRNPYYNYQEKTTRVRVLASPLPQKRKKSLRRTKAALVGSKVDVVLPKKRRPRSQYAQSVMRDIKRQEIAKAEDVQDDSEEVVVSKVRPRPRKLVSFRKYPTTHVPDNTPKVEDVASRLKSMLKKYRTISAEQQAAHVSSVKSRVVSEPSKSVHKYMSPIDKEIKSKITSVKEEVSAEATTGLKAHPRVPGSLPQSLENFQPMSDVRRRVRRVICKNREDPKWFK